jgi:calcineurin-like phosphoesterase
VFLLALPEQTTMTRKNSSTLASLGQYTVILILAASILSLVGCGSTKVYTADKTVVYNGTIYNLGNVQKVGSRLDGLTPDGTVINLRGKDKKEIEKQLKENESMMVSAVVELDDQDMVYERRNVTKYSEFSSLNKRFDRALNDISKFMADKKKTQLKLK